MQYAIIENNVIDNIAESDEPLAPNWEPLPEGTARGWSRTALGQPWIPPALPFPAVPAEVLRWQAVRALRLHDDPNAPQNAPGRSCLDTINALRDAIPDENLRADVDDALLHVMTWRRASPTLAMMATSAGWSDAFVDQLFIAAAGYDL